jgi:DGQHR domain-containing protein
MSDKLGFTLPVIKIHQREDRSQSIFVSKISARELTTRADENFKIDYFRRIEGMEDKGYQRKLLDSSVDKIKNFVLTESKNPMFPTAILVNSRQQLDPDFKDSGNGIGTLTIKGELFIIDGQHRFEAWKILMQDDELAETYGDYEFPLVILSGFEEYKEIEQFYVINSKQKKIKTDLAQRNLLKLASHPDTKGLVQPGKEWENYALVMVNCLNEQFDGIWKRKIGLPDDSSDLSKIRYISQNSFISSLKPFFTGNDPIFKFKNGNNQLDDWAKIINNFWEIVKKYYPNAVENKREYSLVKTVGVFPFHMLLAKQLADHKNPKDALAATEKKISKAVSNNLGESFWRIDQPSSVKQHGMYAGAYSSAVGHRRIAMALDYGSL